MEAPSHLPPVGKIVTPVRQPMRHKAATVGRVPASPPGTRSHSDWPGGKMSSVLNRSKRLHAVPFFDLNASIPCVFRPDDDLNISAQFQQALQHLRFADPPKLSA